MLYITVSRLAFTSVSYLKYNVERKRAPRKNGEAHLVSNPFHASLDERGAVDFDDPLLPSRLEVLGPPRRLARGVDAKHINYRRLKRETKRNIVADLYKHLVRVSTIYVSPSQG